jgi:hypothetical protein
MEERFDLSKEQAMAYPIGILRNSYRAGRRKPSLRTGHAPESLRARNLDAQQLERSQSARGSLAALRFPSRIRRLMHDALSHSFNLVDGVFPGLRTRQDLAYVLEKRRRQLVVIGPGDS